MSYKVEDLNPCKPVLILNNTELTFSLVTLQKENIFSEKFGSLGKTFEAINENPENIYFVLWTLLENKTDFKSLEVFKKFILTSNENFSGVGIKLLRCFQSCVAKSMPLIKNKKRYAEIQKIKNSQVDDNPCYAIYFDTIAKRYSYSLDDFYNLTLRQIYIMLETINNKAYDELQVQASLAGRELKPRMVFNDISEEEEEENNQQALDAVKRLREEYEKRKKGQ